MQWTRHGAKCSCFSGTLRKRAQLKRFRRPQTYLHCFITPQNAVSCGITSLDAATAVLRPKEIFPVSPDTIRSDACHCYRAGVRVNLPLQRWSRKVPGKPNCFGQGKGRPIRLYQCCPDRSEEHTSEL